MLIAMPIPTEEDVLGWMTALSNWARWGPEDELGTLNLITPGETGPGGAPGQRGDQCHLLSAHRPGDRVRRDLHSTSALHDEHG